jgi:hypothetical protein
MKWLMPLGFVALLIFFIISTIDILTEKKIANVNQFTGTASIHAAIMELHKKMDNLEAICRNR